MEVHCGNCGHQMTMVSHTVKIGGNGRAYIDLHYECSFDDCPKKSRVNIQETYHGVDDNSDIRISQL